MASNNDYTQWKKQLKDLGDLITSHFKKQSPLDKAKQERISINIILTQAVGFIMILLSWYFQNKMMADTLDERYEQDILREKVMHLETQLDVLGLGSSLFGHFTYGRDSIEYSDTLKLQYLMIYGQNLVAYHKAALQMVRMKEGIMADSTFALFNKDLYNDSVDLVKYGKMDSIKKLETFVTLYGSELRHGELGVQRFIDAFNWSVRVTKANLEKTNKYFVVLYILGSFFLGVSYYLQLKKDYAESQQEYLNRRMVAIIIMFSVILAFLLL